MCAWLRASSRPRPGRLMNKQLHSGCAPHLRRFAHWRCPLLLLPLLRTSPPAVMPMQRWRAPPPHAARHAARTKDQGPHTYAPPPPAPLLPPPSSCAPQDTKLGTHTNRQTTGEACAYAYAPPIPPPASPPPLPPTHIMELEIICAVAPFHIPHPLAPTPTPIPAVPCPSSRPRPPTPNTYQVTELTSSSRGPR